MYGDAVQHVDAVEMIATPGTFTCRIDARREDSHVVGDCLVQFGYARAARARTVRGMAVRGFSDARDHSTFLLNWGNVTSISSLVTFVVGPEGEGIAFEEKAMGHFERKLVD
jgi:hypothetical protein